MTDTGRGRVLRNGDEVRLEFVRRYDSPAAAVWSALIDPDRLARWFGSWRGDPASGSVEVRMAAEPDSGAERVRIDECDPPRRLAVTIGGPAGPWPLVLTLREEGNTTVLHFVHHLAEPFDASSIGPGWQFYLDRLGAAVADEPVPENWDAYYPALAVAYASPDPSE